MSWKVIFIIFYILINCLEANASILQLNEKKSKITYTLSQQGFPINIKRKSLPTRGQIKLDDKSGSIESLSLKTSFTSKLPFFRKFINFDKYPDFQFVSKISDSICLKDSEVVELSGMLLFHGVSREVVVKLKNESTDKDIVLIGDLNIKMSDFGLKPPRFLFIKVADVIKNKVELYADLGPSCEK